MKLVTYVLKHDDLKEQKVGALCADEAQVVDLQKACAAFHGQKSPYFENMIAFLAGREQAKQLAQDLLAKAGPECKTALGDVKLLAPVPRPLTLRDTMCHEGHLVNVNKVALQMAGKDISKVDPKELKPSKIWYELPMFYKANINSVIGTDEEVAFPEGETFKDYELELAFYINKVGKNINARDAMDYIGGYTIFNDFSSRMIQLKEMDKQMHVGPGVGKDFANGMGPCLVTPDSFNPDNALMVVRVNGQERGRGNHGDLYHKIPDIIEHISNNTTLYPGDVIATGTVAFGSGIEIGKPLGVGDIVELEIENIGVLRHKIVAPPASKVRNKRSFFKRYVCAAVDGKSDFVIDDYTDVVRGGTIADFWKLTETPAGSSATVQVDQGILPFEHEAPANGSIFRYIEVPPVFGEMPRLSALPEAKRRSLVDMLQEIHKSIGTHEIPTEQDMDKHISMHKTDSLNMFICLSGTTYALSDREDVLLQPGDALIQLGNMHGWKLANKEPAFVGGILISADKSSAIQLTDLPQPVLKSKLHKFKRVIQGTVADPGIARGQSTTLIEDYSPNESELYDENGECIGFAGEIWKSFSARADLSGKADVITGPMQAKPPKNGITMRMVELLPHCTLKTDDSIVNYYSIAKGTLNAVSEGKKVVVRSAENIVQLKAKMALENASDEPVLVAHFMIDTAQ